MTTVMVGWFYKRWGAGYRLRRRVADCIELLIAMFLHCFNFRNISKLRRADSEI